MELSGLEDLSSNSPLASPHREGHSDREFASCPSEGGDTSNPIYWLKAYVANEPMLARPIRRDQPCQCTL